LTFLQCKHRHHVNGKSELATLHHSNVTGDLQLPRIERACRAAGPCRQNPWRFRRLRKGPTRKGVESDKFWRQRPAALQHNQRFGEAAELAEGDGAALGLAETDAATGGVGVGVGIGEGFAKRSSHIHISPA
jgi:hypothetical protein